MRLMLMRRITQLATVVMLVAIPILNKNGVDMLTGSLYSLAVGPLWITDPLSGLQVILATLTADATLLVSILIPIVFAMLFGRVFCGWMCPQNLLSEAIDYLSRKTGWNRLLKLPPTPVPRYSVLVAMLALTLLFGFPVANLVSAPGIISVQISEYIMAGTVGLETALIVVILLSEFFIIRRGCCNYLCPVGGFLGVFRTSKTLKVVYLRDGDQCIKCGECVKACQLGLNPMGGKIYPLCHNCGECISACEMATGKKKPLSFKF